MTVEQERYSELEKQLSDKKADYEELSKQYGDLLAKIKDLSAKKNSVLDLLSADDSEQFSTQEEILRLDNLEKTIDVSALLQFVKKEVTTKDLKIDPTLLYLLTDENI